jgi:uncharacterized protein YndB with AHSA1/START domain
VSATPTIPPLTGTITIDAPIDGVFRTFTDGFGSWWPAQYHIGQADMATAILEPRQGGRWYEQGVDGGECDWGRVLAWEPPHRLVVTWQINGQWQYDPDPATPARSRSASPLRDPTRPRSSWSTGAWSGWSTARPSATESPVAAAGPASWNCSLRPPPTRPDPAARLSGSGDPLAAGPASTARPRLHHPGLAQAGHWHRPEYCERKHFLC